MRVHGQTQMLSEKELRDHFNMPLNEVAKKFGMCTTALKKLCRKYGVMQWPHRKLRSLEKKIASLRAEQVRMARRCAKEERVGGRGGVAAAIRALVPPSLPPSLPPSSTPSFPPSLCVCACVRARIRPLVFWCVVCAVGVDGWVRLVASRVFIWRRAPVASCIR